MVVSVVLSVPKGPHLALGGGGGGVGVCVISSYSCKLKRTFLLTFPSNFSKNKSDPTQVNLFKKKSD